jgi:hypothetical protein
MSKRFSRLKTRLGYDARYDEHSIRHTVIQSFREAHCPLEVRHFMLGHEQRNEKMSAGAGYGDLSPGGRRKWMRAAIKYECVKVVPS